MNILFYSFEGFNPEQGGVERVSNNLAKGFMDVGHKVFFVALMDEDYIPIVEQLTLMDKKEICSQRNLTHFIDFVVSRKIDVIICQHCYTQDFTYLAHLVKKATSVKLLYAFHTTPDYMALLIEETSIPVLPSQRTFSKHYRRIQRILFKKQKQKSRNKKMGLQIKRVYEWGDGMVLLSEKYIPIACDITGINSQEKFYGIGNPNTYHTDELRIVEKENTLLFVGRLSIEKRPEKVLTLWKEIQHQFPDWNVKIVGIGNLQRDLDILKNKYQLERLTFEGRQNPKPYYEEAKVILVTSDIEGFGVVITEAMQNGVVPVVFESYKALSDIVDDNVTGMCVKPYDLREFQDKLTQLMNDNDKLDKMSVLCRAAVKKFDTKILVKEWEGVFRKIGLPC